MNARRKLKKFLSLKIKEKIRCLEERLLKSNMERYCYKLMEKELKINEMNNFSLKTRFLIVRKMGYFVGDLYDCIKDTYCSEFCDNHIYLRLRSFNICDTFAFAIRGVLLFDWVCG